MKAVLQLEDGSRQVPDVRKVGALPVAFAGVLRGILRERRPWVAHLAGYDPKFKFKRDFLDGQVDYALADTSATHGVFMFFILQDGQAYEAHNPIDGRFPQRFFCTPDSAGGIKLIDEAEARRLIDSNTSEGLYGQESPAL